MLQKIQNKNQSSNLSHITFIIVFLITTLLVVFLTEPSKSIWFVFLFYASLAGLCLNFFMFVLESLIYRPKRNMEAAVHEGADSKIAARQALMLTILVLGLMFLSSQQLLYWWLALIFIVAMVFVEGFFLVS